jgi:hypothetical protein
VANPKQSEPEEAWLYPSIIVAAAGPIKYKIMITIVIK